MLVFALVFTLLPSARAFLSEVGERERGRARGPAGRTHAFPRTYHIWDSWVGAEPLARYDMVVGFANYDVVALRAFNPGGIFLMHPGLDPRAPGDAYGPLNVSAGAYARWRGGCDSTRDGPARDLGCIRRFNPYWDYLHNADGSLALAAGPGPNLADPQDKGTAELVAKLIALSAKRGRLYRDGWDGIFSDNWIFTAIGDSWFFGPRLDTDRDRKVDDPATMRRNWMNGLVEVGHRLRTYLPGKIIGGNGSWFAPERWEGSDPEGWLKSSNLTQVEFLEQFYDRPHDFVKIARTWLDYPDPFGQRRYVAVRQLALRHDGRPLRIPPGADPNRTVYMHAAGVMRSMRWGLTLALMGSAYYGIHVDGHDNTRWWYDEFDGGEGVRKRGYLGGPRGPARELPSGVWRRDFENGLALNNSTSTTVGVPLERAYRHLRGRQNPALNSGRLTRSVRLGPHDGVILLTPSARR